MKPIQFEKINFGSQSYQFINRVELNSNEAQFLDHKLTSRRMRTTTNKTSLRLDRYLLWQLELISRVSSEKRISDNRTYGDILSNLLKYVYYPETLSIDDETLLLPKKYLNKLYLIEDNNYKVATLPSLTWDEDYILRTIKLAIYDPHLLSVFESNLLQTILVNEWFVDEPYKLRGLASLGKVKKNVVTIDMINFLKDEVELNWYSIFSYFGECAGETFIQKQVNNINKALTEGKKPSPEGYLSKYTSKSVPDGSRLEEWEAIDNDDEKEIYMKSYLAWMHEQWLDHFCKEGHGNFENEFRASVALSKKQGDFMTYL